MLQQSQSIDGGQALSLTWNDGETARFHAVWLRDNALDAETRAPGNGQRLVTVLDIPEDTLILNSAITSNGDLEIEFAPDNKLVTFPFDWLAERIYDRSQDHIPGWIPDHMEPWDKGLENHLPTVSFSVAKNDPVQKSAWLEGVRRYGIAIMTDVPCEEGAVCDVAELFGYVRETNYGRLFEVRSEIDPVNLAYTNLGLQAHTDNPYRDPVPTLQLLACLENSVEGGESIIVDGFHAARVLRNENPEAFDLLARYCTRFEYAGEEGVRLQSRRPMIELAPDGELVSVRFNSRSAAAPVDIPYDNMSAWYDAWRAFARIIERPDMEVTFKMSPGDLIIFDNTRTLHARTGFSGTGSRWLQGCYADRDALLSLLAARDDGNASS